MLRFIRPSAAIPASLATTVISLAIISCLLPGTVAAQNQAARDINAPTALPSRTRESAQNDVANPRDILRRSSSLYNSMLGYLYLQKGDPGQAYAHIMNAARQAPDARLYQQATEIALRGRSENLMLQALEHWKTDFPQDPRASHFHLQLLIASGRLHQTSTPLQAALDATEDSKKQAFLHAIPEFYESADNAQAALDAARPVLEKAAQRPETAFIAATSLARMQLAVRQYPQALQSLQQAFAAQAPSEKLGALPNRELPGLVALDLMRASQQTDPDTAKDAEALVRKAMEQEPSRDFLVVYARALVQARRLQDAQQVLGVLLRKAPDYAPGWIMQGALQTEIKQWKAAHASLQRYLKLRSQAPDTSADTDESLQANERDLQAYLMLARIADAHNRPQEAQKWIARIAPASANRQAQLQRVEWLAQEGQLDRAKQLLSSLPSESAEERTMLALLHAHVLEKQKRLDEALRILNDALHTDDPENVELLYARGSIYWELGRQAESEEDMRAVMRLKPDSAAAYNFLGYSLADRNIRLQEAHTLISKALELAPDSSAIQDSMGWVEYRLGNLPRALELLKQAYEGEQDAEIAAHYGEALWKNGQQEEARKIWAEALKRDAKHKVLLETMHRLDGKTP